MDTQKFIDDFILMVVVNEIEFLPASLEQAVFFSVDILYFFGEEKRKCEGSYRIALVIFLTVR